MIIRYNRVNIVQTVKTIERIAIKFAIICNNVFFNCIVENNGISIPLFFIGSRHIVTIDSVHSNKGL